MRYLATAVLSMVSLASDCTDAPQRDRPEGRPPTRGDAALVLQEKTALASGYADSSINVSVFRHSAILSTADRTLVAFYDEEGFARVDVLDRRRRPLGWFRLTPRITDRLLEDGHCVISLGATPAGDVAVVYGAHGRGSVAYQAEIPGALLGAPGSGDPIEATAWSAGTMTYPQFYVLGGELRLFFRADRDPTAGISARIATTRWLDEDGRLDERFDVLASAADEASIYMEQLAIEGERAALLWMYRKPQIAGEDPPVIRNEGIYLAQTADGGETWTGLRGDAGLPALVKDERLLALPILEDRPMNQTSAAYGPGSTLYSAQFRLDERGVYQIFLVELDLETGSWKEDIVSDNTEPFDLAGRGTLVLPLSRPELAVSRRAVHVIYRRGTAVVVASRPHGSAPRPWTRTSHHVAELGPWEPNFDPTAWSERRELLLYVQPVRQADGDHGIPGDPTTIELWRFLER